jgi:hypothetical protein
MRTTREPSKRHVQKNIEYGPLSYRGDEKRVLPCWRECGTVTYRMNQLGTI